MALKGNNICNDKDLQLQGFLTDSESHPSVSINTQPLLDDYHVESKPFARGKFATVRRCTDKTNDRIYAAKYIKKRRRSANVRHEIMHEILVLRMCDPCPRVINLHQIYEGSSEMILILEMAKGGELQRLLDDDEVFEESQVVHVITQVLEALLFLHGLNIVHLDIKPQNILLTGSFPQCDIKLCDFGISRLVSEDVEVREIVGTPDYVAPEILQYEPISFASDMWSVGVLTYVLLSGYTPFGGATKQETFCNITKGSLEFPEKMFEDVSNHAKDFIKKLLVQNQRQRMLPSDCLKHPWIAPNFEDISTQNVSSKAENIELESTLDENKNYMVNSYTQNTGGLLQQNHFDAEELSLENVQKTSSEQQQQAALEVINVEEETEQKEESSDITERKQQLSVIPVKTIIDQPFLQITANVPKYQPSVVPVGKMEENQLLQKIIFLPEQDEIVEKMLSPPGGNVLHDSTLEDDALSLDTVEKHFSSHERECLQKCQLSALPVEAMKEEKLVQKKNELPEGSWLPEEITMKQEEMDSYKSKVSSPPAETEGNKLLLNKKRILSEHKVSTLPMEREDGQKLFEDMIPRHKVSILPVETVDEKSLSRHKVSTFQVETMDEQSLSRQKASVLPVETIDEQSLSRQNVSVLPVETAEEKSLHRHKFSVLPVVTVDDQSLLHEENVLLRHKISLLSEKTVDDRSLFHKEKDLPGHKLPLLSEETLDSQSLLTKKNMLPRHKVSELPEEGVKEKSLFYKENVLPRHNRCLFPVETEDDLLLFHKKHMLSRHKVSLLPAETPEDLPFLLKKLTLFPNLRHRELLEEIPVTQNRTFLSQSQQSLRYEELLKFITERQELPPTRPLIEEHHRNFQKSAGKLQEMPSLFEDYVHFSSFESTSQGARTIYMRDETVLSCNKSNLNNKLMITDDAFLKTKMHDMLF